MYIKRILKQSASQILALDKNILLLGPRQTGKTTMLSHQLQADLDYTFLLNTTRMRFEQNPDSIINEITAYRTLHPHIHLPTILIDEVQKVPAILDPIQYAIDQKLAKFVLTGSSARQLKRNRSGVNLLPGRVIELQLASLSLNEMHDCLPTLEELLLYGSLPEIVLQSDLTAKEQLLQSYVSIYLEEEIRAEALVRNLAAFTRFLRYAAIDSGKELNISKVSQEIGVSRHLIYEYYQILQDCLIVQRIDALSDLRTRRRLTKSPKYLMFDLGVRRIAAGEGLRIPEKYYGDLFEQFVGLEILKFIYQKMPQARLYYWKDHNGPEVDYVIDYNHQYIAIEVKYTLEPRTKDAKHLLTFIAEHDNIAAAFIICRAEKPTTITDEIIALNWRELPQMLDSLLTEL